MPYDPTIHHRRSIRLKGYDYRSAGAYFVTIVTTGRLCWFGSVHEAGKVTLTPAGLLIQRYWQMLPRHNPGVRLDEFIVMPNHLHAILWLASASTLEAETLPPLSPARPNGTRSGSLNAILQNYKSVSTRKFNQARRQKGFHLWQQDYYEHIIKNETELANMRLYIQHNPWRWRLDNDNSKLPPLPYDY